MGALRSARRASRCSPAKPGARAAARILLAALSVWFFATAMALAQTARPTITVAATLPAEPATQAPLAIRVGPPDSIAKGSFIRIRGLPPTIALSDGHSIAPGSWAVPIAALSSLKITLPAGAAGKSEISITLVGSDGSITRRGKIRACRRRFFAAGQPDAEQERTSANLNFESGHPASTTFGDDGTRRCADSARETGKAPPEQRDRALRLLKRGDEQLAEGGIAQARLLYERAAEAGLAQGAMSMAAHIRCCRTRPPGRPRTAA